jgi:1-acyl-sn-glycerol-3-phosphate acyltransferase
MGVGSGMARALRDLAGAFVPLRLREVERQIAERIEKIPTKLNEFGFDPYGFSPASAQRSALPAALLYRYYFRVETSGIEQVPAGRVLLVANHAGQLPFDGMMVGVAMLLEAEPPRIVRAMGEHWLPTLPWVSVWMARGGVVSGTRETCAEMLEAGETVLVFPEGVRGMNKTFSERYRLQRFGPGFMRLALATETPIVPLAIVGSEEQQPGFANLPAVGRLFGMPGFPITPTFPWLGPLGLLPLPVKYRIRFGAPLHFEGSAEDDDAEIDEKVREVRQAVTELLAEGRRARRGVFR